MDFALARKRLGMTQAQVAEKLGIDQSTVAGWEQGRWKPAVQSLPRVAAFYGVTVDELLNGKDNNQNET